MLETVGTESPEARTPMAQAVGELAFRFHGGDFHGRIARVRAAKCTIGSAPDCTLRLAEAGVRPLHCVIFRGDAGATVRRWSPDTQLNGRAFSDALLMAGDRLQIGPVELEVIDDAALAFPRSQRQASSAASSASPLRAASTIPVASLAGEIVEHLKRDLDPKQDESKLLRERKRVRQARQRVKQFKAKLVRFEESSVRLQSESERLKRELDAANERRLEADRQLQRLTHEGLSSNVAIDQLRREADDARRQLEREITSASEDRKRLEQSLDDVRTRLVQRDAELTQLRNELDQRVDNWRRERAELQATIENHQKQAAEHERAGEAESRQRQQEQTAWQQERLSLLKSLEEKQHLEHRLEVALLELRKAVDQEHLSAATDRQELQAERDKLQQRAEELENLQRWCDEVEQRAQQAARDEAAAQNEVLRLRDRIVELEAGSDRRSNHAISEPLEHDNALRQQTEEARRAQVAAELESERLRSELQGVTQELQRSRDEYESLRAEHEQQTAATDERNSRLLSQTAELAGLTGQVSALESRCFELQGLLASRSAEQWPLLERVEQLEQQLIAASAVAVPTAPACDVAEPQAKVESLEAELCQRAEELTANQTLVAEVNQQLADREAAWTKREQELLKQLQCVENLARHLEENLRAATDEDAAEQAKAEKLELEQQLAASQEKLAAAQRQWGEQRELLEEQALSAHQQVQTLEERLDMSRQSLEESRAQVREREELLSQLRDEVRQQMATWQRERDELQQELEQARLQPQPEKFLLRGSCQEESNDTNREAFISATEEPTLTSYTTSDPTLAESVEHADEDRYADRALLARFADQESEPESVEEQESSFTDNIAQPTVYEGCTSESPVKVDDVLARLGAAGIWRDEAADGPETLEADALRDEHPTAEPRSLAASLQLDGKDHQDEQDDAVPVAWYSSSAGETTTEDAMAGPSEEDFATHSDDSSPELSQPAASAPVSEDEDSIEAYMARLLKRVRGEAVANAFVVQQAPVKTGPGEVEEPSREVASKAEQPVSSEEFVPRSQAPEQTVDLAAMRELAIHSARQAITQSTQRRQRQAAIATTSIVVGSILGSGSLLYWGWQIGNPLAYAGAFATLIGGICWAIRRIRRAPRSRANASPGK